MRNYASDRRGFTLIEVLVTLILLAVLAAAVFPVVTQQANDADPVKGAQDLTAIRTGIETFNLNVRGAYPGDLDDLATQITTTTDSLISRATPSSPYGVNDSLKWNGPYVDASVQNGGTIPTAYGVPIRDGFTRYNAASNLADGAGGFTAAGSLFVAAVLGSGSNKLSVTQFEALNDIIDGEGETDGASGSWVQGKLRRNDSVTATDTLTYYLAVPIEK